MSDWTGLPTLWKQAEGSSNSRGPKLADSAITVATTSERMEDAQEAADGDYPRSSDDSVVFTKLERAEPALDGGTEHNEPTVLIDGKKPKTDDSSLTDHFATMSADQRMANRRDYIRQRDDVASLKANFNEVAYSKDVKLPMDALEMLADGGLPNSGHVQHYLGEHPQVAAAMIGLSRKQVQARVREISAGLATDPNYGIDTASFAEYRAGRNRQIASRYR